MSSDNSINTSTPAGSAQQRFQRLSVPARLACTGAMAMLLLMLFNLLLVDRSAERRFLEHYGGLVTEQIARLAKDAMVREDAIAMNVLAEQVASDPAIGSVIIYSLEGQKLASYGIAESEIQKSDELEFNRPIQLADATAGFVRVTIIESVLRAPRAFPMNWWDQLRPLTSLVLAILSLWGILHWLTRPQRGSTDSRQTSSEDSPAILLAVNLFNASQMSPGRRDALIGAAKNRLTEVSQIYNATLLPLTPSAVGLVFDPEKIDGPHFQAACAALVIAQLCNQPGGARYRYSLQEGALSLTDGVIRQAKHASEPSQALMSDALIYAALANDNTIALSSQFAQSIRHPERLELSREHSPALASLQSKEITDYYLLSGAQAATQSMINSQVEALSPKATAT